MKNPRIAALALGAVLAASTAQAADTAQYEVKFNATWSAATHPLDYPGDAHFSGIIGATHDPSRRCPNGVRIRP